MIKTENGFTTITCDKCGTSKCHDEKTANDRFFESGWGLFPHARKYTHKCSDCQTKKARKAHDFVKRNFYVSR